MVWAQAKGEPADYDLVKAKLYDSGCFTKRLSTACPEGYSVDDFEGGFISCSSNSESLKDYADITVNLVAECETVEPVKEPVDEPVFEVLV